MTSTIRYGNNHACAGGDNNTLINGHIDGVNTNRVRDNGKASTCYGSSNRIGIIYGPSGRTRDNNAYLSHPTNRRCKVCSSTDFVCIDRASNVLRGVVKSVDALNTVFLCGENII